MHSEITRRTLLAAAFAPPRFRRHSLGKGWAATQVNCAIFSHPLASDARNQYAAWYDGKAEVILARRTWSGQDWKSRATGLTGNTRDAHNGIALGVDGAGTLHMAWDHHNHPLRYVRSTAPGSLDLTEKLAMNGELEERVTYPEFYPLANGDLLFLYRLGASGNGITILKRWHVRDRRWSTLQRNLLDGQGGRNAYTNGIAIDARGVWHLSWCWRETPDVLTNHDICYARSTDEGRTWQTSAGKPYSLPITQDTAEVVLPVPQRSGLINQTTMAVTREGLPRIATYFRPAPGKAAHYHLVWHDGKSWRSEVLGPRNLDFVLAGPGSRSSPFSRPLVLVSRSGRTWVVYRDEERGNQVTLARNESLGNASWSFEDLAVGDVGRWEPVYDAGAWARSGNLCLLLQKVGQGERETPVPLDPTPVEVVEVSLERGAS
jgi:hypothetical protein